MLANLRRSIISVVVFTAFFGFVYALAGTGVAQVLFPHQADGSITANGSTLIGQNWAATKCSGHPAGSCVFHGRPDDTGPYAANPKENISGGDNPLVANGIDGSSGATNLGPRSKVLLDDTKKLVAYWHSLGIDPTTRPGDHLGQWARPRHHASGRDRPDPDGIKGNGSFRLSAACSGQQGEPRCAARFPREQLRRRASAKRSPVKTSIAATGNPRPLLALPSAFFDRLRAVVVSWQHLPAGDHVDVDAHVTGPADNFADDFPAPEQFLPTALLA